MEEHAPSQHAIIPVEGPSVDPDLPRLHLKIMAEAAERLLAADDSARMVDELFALIRSELRLDVFFNYRLEQDRLVLEAHAGLTEEQAAAGAELALGQAVCGCAARERRRYHVTGVQASDDPLVAFVKQVGLDAYACTPLVYGGELIGTLGFGRRWADRFSDDEISLLHTLCHYVALAKHRLQLEQDLRAGIEQRERLLNELNHRVRNALQLAVSMVRLEAASEADRACAAALARVGDRIEVIAAAHRPIYAADDLRTVEVAELLRAVSTGLKTSTVRVIGAPRTTLPIEQGVAFALLIHTILTLGCPSGEPASIEIVGDASTATVDVIVKGLNMQADLLGGRFQRAFLRQLSASAASDAGAVTITLPVRSDER
ncbi:Histidine kinase [Sphingomonas jatrophae]|uniref:histidine kinase n=2 Tax=Sphingomonas jatrophae TaxID=1166337 RepID=A0A1I6JNG5_9SPHN|nr:Histidine kinase [Sphingomonas jatrophae]